MEAMARDPAVEQNNSVKGIFGENFRGLVLLLSYSWDICQEARKSVNPAAFTSFIPAQFSLGLSVVHHLHALLEIQGTTSTLQRYQFGILKIV